MAGDSTQHGACLTALLSEDQTFRVSTEGYCKSTEYMAQLKIYFVGIKIGSHLQDESTLQQSVSAKLFSFFNWSIVEFSLLYQLQVYTK